MIARNSLKDKGAGFGHDTNKITLLIRGGATVALPLQSKTDTAEVIIDNIIKLRHAKETA